MHTFPSGCVHKIFFHDIPKAFVNNKHTISKLERATMSKVVFSLFVSIALMAGWTFLVTAQEESLGYFQPFAINILHEEPVTVTSTQTIKSGEIVTVTTPITLSLDLRINVIGPSIVKVATDGSSVSNVELVIAEPEPAPTGRDGFIDSSERVYTADAPDGIVIGQVQSKDSVLGTEIFGIVTNDTDDELKFLQATVQFYDEDGTLLGVNTGYASLEEIPSGKSSSFQVLGQVDYGDVAGYSIQVEP